MNGHGSIYKAIGQYDNALPFFEDAANLAKTIPNNETQVAVQLNNLALLLSDKVDYDGAITPQQQALEIWKKSLGNHHPQVATGLNNLALLLRDTGKKK